MRRGTLRRSVVGTSDHHEAVHRLTLAIKHVSRADDPADLVNVKQAERVVSSVEVVSEVVVRRTISVSCQRRANLRPDYQRDMFNTSLTTRRGALLALVTRDLILAFPVTYLAKTRLNLL